MSGAQKRGAAPRGTITRECRDEIIECLDRAREYIVAAIDSADLEDGTAALAMRAIRELHSIEHEFLPEAWDCVSSQGKARGAEELS